MWTWEWLFVLEAVVLVTGNVIVLMTFTQSPSLRKRQYYLLVTLAVADLHVGLVSVPMYLTATMISSRKFTTAYTFQDVLFGTATVFGLAAVAIERAYATYFPFKHRTLWKGAYMIGIAVIWVLALLTALLVTFNRHRTLFTGSVTIFVCLATVVTSYVLIWIKMTCMTSAVANHAVHRVNMKLTVTLLIVTVLSLIAWIPFHVIVIHNAHCPGSCLDGLETLVIVAKFLHYGNSLINPFIYALRMPQFQTALRKKLTCSVCCNIRPASTVNPHEADAQQIDDNVNGLHELNHVGCDNEGRHIDIELCDDIQDTKL